MINLLQGDCLEFVKCFPDENIEIKDYILGIEKEIQKLEALNLRYREQIEELKAQLDHQDKHFSDLNLLIDRKNKQLAKAVEVIEFYGDTNNYTKWGYMKINGDDYFDCDKKYLGNDGKTDMWIITGGKIAREFLVNIKENEIEDAWWAK